MARTVSPASPVRSPRRQLDVFLSRYEASIRSLARVILRKMEARLPGATELVYDNYNALVVGFGPNQRATDCPFSIAVYARWVNLYFLEGSLLSDPDGVLEGSGNRVRHITLRHAGDFDAPSVQALITQALDVADPPFPSRGRRSIVIKSVSAKQRSRRPARPRPATVR